MYRAIYSRGSSVKEYSKVKAASFYLVMNISRVVRYRKIIKGQKVKELKPIKVDRVKEWEVEKIINKRKV